MDGDNRKERHLRTDSSGHLADRRKQARTSLSRYINGSTKRASDCKKWNFIKSKFKKPLKYQISGNFDERDYLIATRIATLPKIEEEDVETVVSRKTIAFPGFPRCWSLFGYLLPRETRVRVFEPRQQELLEDYTLARRFYRTRWARRWLVFCFTFRTALMVLECFRAMAVDKMFWWVPWIITAIRGFR